MSFEGYDFAKGFTRRHIEEIKGMKVHVLRDLVDRVIGEVNGEMQNFLFAQRKWRDAGNKSTLKDMRMSLLRLSKLQRSFQIVRAEYLVAESEKRGEVAT